LDILGYLWPHTQRVICQRGGALLVSGLRAKEFGVPPRERWKVTPAADPTSAEQAAEILRRQVLLLISARVQHLELDVGLLLAQPLHPLIERARVISRALLRDLHDEAANIVVRSLRAC
jgi:hypothetical protein